MEEIWRENKSKDDYKKDHSYGFRILSESEISVQKLDSWLPFMA